MDQENLPATISQTEQRIAELTSLIEQAKQSVQQWGDAATSLSMSAAKARAENQSSGRGFFGAVLGSKYRAAVRRGAAASNAAIAQEVAEKREQIAEGKREAQDLVKRLQAELAIAKKELAKQKTPRKNKAAVIKESSASLDLLQKLKKAHDSGLLTEQEYNEKRKQLIDKI